MFGATTKTLTGQSGSGEKVLRDDSTIDLLSVSTEDADGKVWTFKKDLRPTRHHPRRLFGGLLSPRGVQTGG